MKKGFVIGLVILCLGIGRADDVTQWQSPHVVLPDGPSGSVRDQYQSTNSGGAYFWAGRYLAQSFTCGLGGQLSHVNVWGDTWIGEPSLPAAMSIVLTQNGLPTGSLLGSAQVPSMIKGWVAFDFAGQSIQLSEGTQYAFILSNQDRYINEPTNGVSIEWFGNPYAGGALWEWRPETGWAELKPEDPAGADMVFETWMVPEPATVLLFGWGAILLKKKHKKSCFFKIELIVYRK